MPLSNRVCFLINLRDGLACRQCGRKPLEAANYHQGFEYHHVIARSEGGADSVENVILLCHDCHLKNHQGKQSLSPGLLTGLATPEILSCKCCGTSQDAQTVEMNCGWYRCASCREQIHLVDHFRGA